MISMEQNQQNQMKKSFSLSENNKLDESNSLNAQQDDSVDRSCQKKIFESRNKEVEEGLQGDQALSENSFFGVTINQSLQDAQQQSTIHSKALMHRITENNSKSCERRFYDEEVEDLKIIYQEQIESKDSPKQCQESHRKQGASDNLLLKMKTNLKIGHTTFNVECLEKIDSSISIQSKKKLENQKSQKKFKVEFDTQSIQNRKANKSIGLAPEQVIYEKDQNQIKKMVTIALKEKQNQVLYTNTQQRKSMQNFEKAQIIINRLLNNSMSRMMRVRQHVHNFVYFLKLKYLNRRSDNLTHGDYHAINDLSIYLKNNQKNKSRNFFILKLQEFIKFTSKIPIFMPTDSVRVVWDLFQVFFTYIFLYFYSILMFYAQDEQDSKLIQKFFYYAFFLFIIDILINFNTAYFDKDIIINKRNQIAKQYILSTLFVTDCISLIVLGTKVITQSTSIAYNPNHNMITYGFNILIFLKANGMSPKKNRFGYVFTLKESQKHITKLINQLINVITVAHIASIGWYFIGIQENLNSYTTSWLIKSNLSQSSYQEKYIYSIYWAITTMTTVGYGDIAATNQVEALFISINMILFSCVFAYSVNNIGFFLQEIEKSSKQLNDNITTIQRYLNRKNVNISLKSRVMHYLSFLAQEQKDRDKEAEDQIFSILSNKLRDEITLEINTKILSQFHVFSSNFSKQALNKIVFKMTEVLVSPNEVIFYDDQLDDQSIYFIQSGIIEIYQHSVLKQNKINVIQTLTTNQLFGEISFFSGLSRSASARSVNLSTLYKIKRDDFISILKETEEDFERFKMIQEQIIFQQEIHQIFVECYTCKQIGHISSSCPKTHQSFDRQFIILKNNFSFFQERLKKPRNQNTIKYNKFTLLKQNKDICQLLKENLKDLNTEINIMFITNESVNEDYTSDEEDEEEYYDEENCQPSEYQAQNSNVSSQSNKSLRKLKSKQMADNIKKQIKMQKKEEQKKQLSSDNSITKIQSQDNNEGCITNNDFSDVTGNQINFIQGDLYSPSNINSTNNNNNNSQKKNNQEYNRMEIQENQETPDLEKKKNQKIKDKPSSKHRGKEHSGQQPQKQVSETNMETSLKNIGFQSSLQGNNSNIDNFYIVGNNKCSSKLIEDISYSNQDAIKTQIEPIPSASMLNSEYKNLGINNLQRRQSQKKIQSQNSGKNFNIDHSKIRYSIDNMLIMQGFLNQQILQATRQSFRDQKLPKKLQENLKLFENDEQPLKRYLSHKSNNKINSQLTIGSQNNSQQKIKDPQDQKLYKNLQTLLHSTSIGQNNPVNQKQSLPLNRIEQIQNNEEQLPHRFQSEGQLTERLSHILMSNQLPLMIQQYTAGMSLREMQSMNPQLSMDQFDKMQNFKKFFPHNNFEKVENKIKSKLLENKKLKKLKIFQKPRRQNILLPNSQTRESMFNINSGFFRLVLQEFNPNLYKPTYLSYGTGMKKEIHPINNYYLN